jgi:hypothetical protein
MRLLESKRDLAAAAAQVAGAEWQSLEAQTATLLARVDLNAITGAVEKAQLLLARGQLDPCDQESAADILSDEIRRLRAKVAPDSALLARSLSAHDV